jgi:LysM repeat protein
MLRRLPGWYWTVLLSVFSLGIGILAPNWMNNQATPEPEVIIIAQNATATETLLPATPRSTRTATQTLLPPPTIEPPTATSAPSNTPTMTSTQPFIVNITVEGIQGLPSATAVSEEACEARDDWQLQHEIQTNETLTMIAERYGTNIWELSEGNCLDDANVIRVGQFLRVPSDTLPIAPAVDCIDYTLLQPIDGAWDIASTGNITFNWRGPRAPRNLIRIYTPDYDFSVHDPDKYFDYAFDLRQNETIDLIELEAGGTWYWQVIPLDSNFVQVCPESPLWTFNKNPLNEDEE